MRVYSYLNIILITPFNFQLLTYSTHEKQLIFFKMVASPPRFSSAVRRTPKTLTVLSPVLESTARHNIELLVGRFGNVTCLDVTWECKVDAYTMT